MEFARDDLLLALFREVPKTTYNRHRFGFYDEASQKWRTIASKRP